MGWRAIKPLAGAEGVIGEGKGCVCVRARGGAVAMSQGAARRPTRSEAPHGGHSIDADAGQRRQRRNAAAW